MSNITTKSEVQIENNHILKNLKKHLDQNKLKELYLMNKKNTIQLTGNIDWNTYKKQIKEVNDENNVLKNELLILKEQLSISQQIREEIYNRAIQEKAEARRKINHNANIVDKLHIKCNKICQQLEWSEAEQKYQRRQKINTRKRFKNINEKYKKLQNENECNKTKLINIQKKLEGITKNTDMNIMKYFQKDFPKIETADCHICCDTYEKCKIKDRSICKNGCNISICEGCFDEMKCCPLCKQVYINKTILSYDDVDYESEGEEDFDFLNGRYNDSIPVEQMVQEMFNPDINVRRNLEIDFFDDTSVEDSDEDMIIDDSDEETEEYVSVNGQYVVLQPPPPLAEIDDSVQQELLFRDPETDEFFTEPADNETLV